MFKDKCVKLHVSPNQRKNCCNTKLGDVEQKTVPCVALEVQDSAMKECDTEKYIGDIVSSDGSNDRNIMNRRSQGFGSISTIFSMLQALSFGYHYVKIGLILRESHLLSKLLLSCESWHRLFSYQIDKLEEIDLAFFHQLFNSHSKTSKEIYIIESGKVPIRYLISMRRIMYWWHILHVKKSDMLFRVYSVQKISPVQGDWVKMLEGDNKLFKIKLSDDEMEAISKYKIQNYLKKRVREVTLEYVEGLKQKHSKTQNFDTSRLSTSPYLNDSRFTKTERELLFKLRSRTIQVKYNFQNANLQNMLCELCNLFTCTQEHVLTCPVLTQHCTIVNTMSVEHNFIYGNVDQQLMYTRIYSQFWDARKFYWI